MTKYNGVHRHQLFHWIGRDIDIKGGDNKTLTDALRKQYIDHLKGSLNNGLWVKTPEKPDYLGAGKIILVNRPMVCFTEWSLGESLPHTSRYGRMGFGFSKQFILSHGGQPVAYVNETSKSPFLKTLEEIMMGIKNLDSNFNSKQLNLFNELQSNFDYLSHFYKKIKNVGERNAKTAKNRLPTLKSRSKLDPFKRVYGRTLHYLEEREWRIVFHTTLIKIFTKNENGGLQNIPEYFLNFQTGTDLFTLVLPDNKTIQMAMEDDAIRNRLFPTKSPHVTLLSLEDIGTF